MTRAVADERFQESAGAWDNPCGRTTGWYMSGNGGNHVIVLPALDAVAVVTTVNYNTRGMHDQTTRLVETYLWSRLRCSPETRNAPERR